MYVDMYTDLHVDNHVHVQVATSSHAHTFYVDGCHCYEYSNYRMGIVVFYRCYCPLCIYV